MSNALPARDWLRLAQAFPRLGPLRQVLQNTTAQQLLQASSRELIHWGLDSKQRKRLTDITDETGLAWLESDARHHLLPFTDPLYPPLLANLDDSPTALWVKGSPQHLSQPQLAIVGSRNATSGGLDNARQFAHHLAAGGLAITSGLAEGVDGAAHAGALDGRGLTIAVTGTGLDRVYPAKHRDLAHRIAEHGVLVSEFAPGTPPLRGNFPSRNRLISGMSLGVLVVEASVRSGSLITARLANEQGREVLAIPGSIHNPLARGCHHLIRQGAKLVETADDVLEELVSVAGQLRDSLMTRINQDESDVTCDNTSQQESPLAGSDKDAEPGQRILEAIGFDPVSIDTLMQRVELTVEELSSILLTLELDGRVSQDARGRYSRCDKRS